MIIYNNYTTCFGLGRELLNRDGFVTVQVGNREYCITGTETRRTHANADDSSVYTVLVCGEEV